MQVRGTLTKHRGLWRIVITYYDAENNRRQKTYSTGLSADKNKRKAEEMLEEKLDEFKKTSNLYQKDEGDMFIWEYVDKYIEKRKVDLRDTTISNYTEYNNSYIKKYFEYETMKDLSTKSVDNFYKHLSENVGDGTASNVIHLFRRAIDMAVEEELLTKNPARIVKRYKSQNDEKQKNKNVLNPDELSEFLEIIKDDILYPLVVVTLYYGIRRGEICGLTWDCVDFDNNKIYIKQTLANTKDGVVFREYCKNKSSVRTLTITDDISEILQKAKKKQEIYKMVYKDKYTIEDHDFVFTTRQGKRRSPKGLTYLYQAMLRKYNLPVSRFHDLRHSAATFMFDKGATVQQVQHTLGHSTPSTTMNVYIHNTDTANEETAKLMSSALKL